jgi:hypothetical protein
MALSRPTPFRRSGNPTIAGGEQAFLVEQLRRLEITLQDLCDLTPQEADAEPAKRRSGMTRLSRAPWRPLVGQTDDVWVYFDGVTQTWKPL